MKSEAEAQSRKAHARRLVCGHDEKHNGTRPQRLSRLEEPERHGPRGGPEGGRSECEVALGGVGAAPVAEGESKRPGEAGGAERGEAGGGNQGGRLSGLRLGLLRRLRALRRRGLWCCGAG